MNPVILLSQLQSLHLTFHSYAPLLIPAGGSSNEDLSDSTEVSKVHVRSRLRKFFAKRPTMEVLVKKGIYKGSILIINALCRNWKLLVMVWWIVLK